MTIYETELNVKMWAEKRGLIEGTTLERQTIKLGEEMGELSGAILKNDMAGIIDGIGDVGVVCANIATKLGVSLTKCVQSNYYEPEHFEKIDKQMLIIQGRIGTISHDISEMKKVYAIWEIGRLIADLSWLARLFDTTFGNCFMSAYNEIKDRDGRMVDGTFVKASDLRCMAR